MIREDNTVSAYDILELHCELVAGRVRFLATQKECPQDMEQAVCTLIWAADRAEVRDVLPRPGGAPAVEDPPQALGEIYLVILGMLGVVISFLSMIPRAEVVGGAASQVPAQRQA